MSSRRNPYIVLGVDFGTPVAEAKRAFALASRRVRRHPDPPFTMEDVTAAEREVQDLADPVRSIGIFRVPADPDAYEPDGAGDLLSLAPRNLPRQRVAAAEEVARELEARVQSARAEAVGDAVAPGLDALAAELRAALAVPGADPRAET